MLIYVPESVHLFYQPPDLISQKIYDREASSQCYKRFPDQHVAAKTL